MQILNKIFRVGEEVLEINYKAVLNQKFPNNLLPHLVNNHKEYYHHQDYNTKINIKIIINPI